MVTSDRPARPVLAIIVTVVWGLAFIPGCMGAMMSPMIFDAGESVMHNPWALWLFGMALAFPVLCLLSIASSWIWWAVMRRRSMSRALRIAQVALACLPLIPIAFLIFRMVSNPSGF
jgi:hypothetical protein